MPLRRLIDAEVHRPTETRPPNAAAARAALPYRVRAHSPLAGSSADSPILMTSRRPDIQTNLSTLTMSRSQPRPPRLNGVTVSSS